jgi:hypothetical protein
MAKTSHSFRKKVSFVEELSLDEDNLVIPSASDSSTILRSQLALAVAAAAGPTPTSEPQLMLLCYKVTIDLINIVAEDLETINILEKDG